MAKDAKQAIRLDKTKPVDDVWVDENWQRLEDDVMKSNNIGYGTR